jgi:hypothetical protein
MKYSIVVIHHIALAKSTQNPFCIGWQKRKGFFLHPDEIIRPCGKQKKKSPPIASQYIQNSRPAMAVDFFQIFLIKKGRYPHLIACFLPKWQKLEGSQPAARPHSGIFRKEKDGFQSRRLEAGSMEVGGDSVMSSLSARGR